MLTCVFLSLVDSLSPKLRGAEIAILTNFTFWPKSSILRNAYLKLFRASKHALNRFFELCGVDASWNTCLGKILEILLSSIFEGPNSPKMVNLGKSIVAKIRQNRSVWAENKFHLWNWAFAAACKFWADSSAFEFFVFWKTAPTGPFSPNLMDSCEFI